MKFVHSFLFGLLLTTTAMAEPQDNGTPPASTLPVKITPNNPDLFYMGRFDMTNTAGPTCAWSGSAIAMRFHGTAVNAFMTLGRNRFEVIVDDIPTKVLSGPGDKTLYNLASGLSDADHTVMLFKDTEPAVGIASFGGFQLGEGGTVLPYIAPKHRLEIIGDSISCGFGNEDTDPHNRFSPLTENAYWSYGAVAARAFDANYTCIAWSGKKLWLDNSMVPLYDCILPPQPEPVWKFDGAKPEVVLINLCTNDFGPGNPEEEAWTKAYHSFIERVRKNYPDATIYLALGSMMNDGDVTRHPLTTARGYIQRVVNKCNSAGDKKVHFIEFATQNIPVDGVGASWHPSIKTDKIMAAKLIDALQKDPGWIPVTKTP